MNTLQITVTHGDKWVTSFASDILPNPDGILNFMGGLP